MSDRDDKLRQLGELLKQERLRQEKSHDEIMEVTKISRRSLVAIEEGDRRELPHPVYAKGFVKNYAGALGLPWERYAELLANSFDLEEEEDDDDGFVQSPLGDESRSDAKDGRGPALAVVLAVILVILLGGLVWYIYSGDGPKTLSEAPAVSTQATAPEEAAPAPEPQPEPAPAPQPEPEAAPQAAAPEADQGQAVQTAEPATTQAEEPAAPAVQEAPAAPAEAAVQEEAAEPKEVVVIKALPEDSCWMQARADQGEIKEYFIREGQVVRLKYEKSLWVRLGNAGGVTVTHDGQSYPMDADPGQVRTLRFGEASEE